MKLFVPFGVGQSIRGLHRLRGAVVFGKGLGRLAQTKTLGIMTHMRLFDVKDGAQVFGEGSDQAKPRNES